MLQTSSDGGGPDPFDLLERRVGALESDVKDIKASLTRMEISLASAAVTLAQMPKMSDFASLRAEIAEVRGKLSSLPTTWAILGIVFTTWGIGSGIVFAIARFAR